MLAIAEVALEKRQWLAQKLQERLKNDVKLLAPVQAIAAIFKLVKTIENLCSRVEKKDLEILLSLKNFIKEEALDALVIMILHDVGIIIMNTGSCGKCSQGIDGIW